MSTDFTTRATHTAMEDTIYSNELCRENEAYFNGLRFLVNKKFQQSSLTAQDFSHREQNALKPMFLQAVSRSLSSPSSSKNELCIGSGSIMQLITMAINFQNIAKRIFHIN
ncbi:hypothetical protein, partial [Vibrio cholerae]